MNEWTESFGRRLKPLCPIHHKNVLKDAQHRLPPPQWNEYDFLRGDKCYLKSSGSYPQSHRRSQGMQEAYRWLRGTPRARIPSKFAQFTAPRPCCCTHFVLQKYAVSRRKKVKKFMKRGPHPPLCVPVESIASKDLSPSPKWLVTGMCRVGCKTTDNLYSP